MVRSHPRPHMELVVLVDKQNNQIGTAPKETVHTDHTPLHRAFSLFLFNESNELLLTKRARTKKTFAGVWTNSACGHPAPGETTVDAAARRLKKELGITDARIKEVAPYTYRFADKNGIVENEICPICIGFTSQEPNPDLTETEEWKWITWDEFITDIHIHGDIYSPWCLEEAIILQQTDLVSL